MRSRIGRAPLIAAVAIVGTVVVAGVVLTGPVEVGPPQWVPAPTRWQPTMPAQPTQAPGPPRMPQGSDTVGRIILLILEVLAVAAAVLVLALIVRFIVRRVLDRRRRVRRARVVVTDAGVGSVADDVAVPAPAMRRGIARALELLDEPRAPADAVVQAWLGLEDAAVLAGAGRGDAETAAEHAARVVQRFDTDRNAAQRLLRLYQDVRFGGRDADADAVAAARESLLRLQASWHDARDEGSTTGRREDA